MSLLPLAQLVFGLAAVFFLGVALWSFLNSRRRVE